MRHHQFCWPPRVCLSDGLPSGLTPWGSCNIIVVDLGNCTNTLPCGRSVGQPGQEGSPNWKDHSRIRSELEAIEQDDTLYQEAGLGSRLEAQDAIEVSILARVDGLLAARARRQRSWR